MYRVQDSALQRRLNALQERLADETNPAARRRLEKQVAEALVLQAEAVQNSAALSETIELHRVVEVLTEAAKTAPDDVDILQKLAVLQNEVKKKWDAAETCRKILELKPGYKFAQDLLKQIGPVTSRPAPAS